MPREIALRGRGLVPGRAEGEALVSPLAFGFWHGIDPRTGEIVDERNPLRGRNAAGKVLVFPYGRGSTGGSSVFLEAVRCGAAPCAIVNIESEPIVTIGALMAKEFYGKQIPIVDRLDRNPLEVIESGDVVLVDGDRGEVVVLKRR
jgi:predicted aconitase with swiveling domain